MNEILSIFIIALFLIGSYLIGNRGIGSFYDDWFDKVLQTFYGMMFIILFMLFCVLLYIFYTKFSTFLNNIL